MQWKTEKNYAITEKDLLVVLLGCKRFHDYVNGNKTFTENEPFIASHWRV